MTVVLYILCFVICTEKYVLNFRKFPNELNVGLSQWVWIRKRVHRVKTDWLSSKGNFLGAAVRKNVMLTVSRNIKVSFTVGFIEKKWILNSVSFCQIIRKKSSHLLNDLRIYNINDFPEDLNRQRFWKKNDTPPWRKYSRNIEVKNLSKIKCFFWSWKTIFWLKKKIYTIYLSPSDSFYFWIFEI